jgi:acyl-CoA thioesterase-2
MKWKLCTGFFWTINIPFSYQKERAIFNMAASFQIDDSGFGHQESAPEVPGPEGLKSELELARQVADKIAPTT